MAWWLVLLAGVVGAPTTTRSTAARGIGGGLPPVRSVMTERIAALARVPRALR